MAKKLSPRSVLAARRTLLVIADGQLEAAERNRWAMDTAQHASTALNALRGVRACTKTLREKRLPPETAIVQQHVESLCAMAELAGSILDYRTSRSVAVARTSVAIARQELRKLAKLYP